MPTESVVFLSLRSLSAHASNRPPGYLEDVLSHAAVQGDRVALPRQAYVALTKKYRGHPPESPAPKASSGPGTELKALLAKIGIKSSPTCSCNRRAKIMDEKGCDWCEENLQEIVGWLKEEHAKRKSLIPFVPLAVEQVVKLAIRRARKKGNSQ